MGINPKVNVIARLEFELTTMLQSSTFSYDTIGDSPQSLHSVSGVQQSMTENWVVEWIVEIS